MFRSSNPWRTLARAIQVQAIRDQDAKFFETELGGVVNALAELEVKPEGIQTGRRLWWESHSVREVMEETGMSERAVVGTYSRYGWVPLTLNEDGEIIYKRST